MEEFLDSFSFEQMAKEYNKKYSKGVLTLSEQGVDFEKTKNLFDGVFKLLFLYERSFGRSRRFNEVSQKVQKLKGDLTSFFSQKFSKLYQTEKPLLFFLNYRTFIKVFVNSLLLFEEVIVDAKNEKTADELKSLKLDYIKIVHELSKLI